jgi:hypothetical protein
MPWSSGFHPRDTGMIWHVQIINVIQHISKDKYLKIILIDTEKVFEKIQHPFMIKALMTLRIEEMYLKLINTIYDKL